MLTFLSKSGVVTPQVPVTALNSLLLLGLALTHTALGLQTVVDTWSVSDDDRRSVPSLSLADSLESLCVVSTHSNLSYVYITVSGSNHTQILLADALTLSSELSNSTKRSSLRGLTTGVRVNLSIEHENVNVLTRSNHVVETAVTDIVRSTVTTDDPLTALYEVVIQSLELLANGATSGSALGDALAELRSNLLRLLGIVLISNPLSSELFVLSAGLIAIDHLLQQLSYALLHLLVTKSHTQTELAEVLEQ